jgi:hypothetical protein
MPNLEEHCKHTFKTYGVEGREIHQWLDNPSRKYAGRHREFRHDSETVKLVGDVFGKKYGRTLAENIALDHIMLDHKEEIQRRNIERAIDSTTKMTVDPFIKKIIDDFKVRKTKRSLSSLFDKWYPKNDDSSYLDCELCGNKGKYYRLYGITISPELRIRTCKKCKDELFELSEGRVG